MENDNKVTAATGADPGTGDSGAARKIDVADSAALLAGITAERDKLARERTELYDQTLRLRAEFDNFRKRAEKQKAEYTEFAATQAIRAILPILDDFERALKHETADKEYSRGMELIYQRLFEAMKKLGLEPIKTEGQRFDPHLHHAVETEKTDRVGDHTILQEHQRGYNFRGKLLRPAMVKVAVKP